MASTHGVPITRELRSLRYYQTVIVLALAVYLYYLVYRLLYTMNQDAPAFSLIFYYAECHGFVSLALYFFQLWHPIRRTPPPLRPACGSTSTSPTYKEEIDLVRKTVLGCINMTYPHQTYILDDGNRAAFAALASELGCGYVTRTERAHAKAGNLNHALSVTDGNLIVVFDADYVPQPDFLDKTLGYFTDDRVAFVQTPQNYYNVDSFSFHFNPKRRIMWNEADLFYRFMMPARDYWDSAFFAGTSAVFRRTALADIGGFATETITEDLHTSVRLYKRGWKGVYHNELLSSGLAATDLKNYHVQKLRWAEGNISLLFADNPLWTRGLTLPQRICFFATVFGWFIGVPKLIYFVTPAVMLLTAQYPIYPFDWPFLWRYGMFLTTIILSVKIVSRGYGRILDEELSNMLNFFVLTKAVVRSLLCRRARFIVTGKGAGEAVSLRGVLPQLTLIGLCIAGVEWAVLKWLYTVSRDLIGLGIGAFWTGMNGLLACRAVATATAPLHRRRDFRFPGGLPVWYQAGYDEGTTKGLGLSTDLNEHGMALMTFLPLPIGEPVNLQLHLGPRILSCDGIVLYVLKGPTNEGVFRYGIQFSDPCRAQQDTITTFCFNRMLPTLLRRFEVGPSLWTKRMADYYDRRRIRRRAARRVVSLPALLHTDPPHCLVTEDISIAGVAFMAPTALAVGERTAMTVFGPFGRLDAPIEIRYCRAIATEGAYKVGAEFVGLPEPSRERLRQLCETGRQERVA
ncbi:MAG: glycosyltransferase [Candidatus Methylomirabilis sp.]|nr:glycosyltransferase [Candidatus Methylomirabilis sp.]